MPQITEPRYLRTAQVAELLQVSPKTVSRWAQGGRLPYVRTLGGHRRYPDREIRACWKPCPSHLRPASRAPRLTAPAPPGVRGFGGRSGSSCSIGSVSDRDTATSSVRERIDRWLWLASSVEEGC